ncbi:nucleotide-diphospho-sugar transferases [Lucifera butyrica]|uniref:Nucleotide-diphospho-sugar transferases n=2 Tax=Lucifera butyrica TaxID=1351585 RepID=A0A498RGV4_9FIRM|nr:nucleotide-diphospho-sugar transferases [Lucifera butyrica]
MRKPISVIIHTFNEEKNIRNCLECVKWADEIIVVDMYSDDKTIEIAQGYTDKIFMYERSGYADPARKFALEQASSEWILVVDADELVPMKLQRVLIDIAESDKYDAVLIPHLNYFFGYPMKGTGWGPLQDMHIRFFKKQYMYYSDKVHDFAHLSKDARLFRLLDKDCAFVHFNFLTVEHYIEKFNRYTTIEAQGKYKHDIPFDLKKIVISSAKEFIRRFLFCKGYSDGFRGLSLSLLMVTYQLVINLKLKIMYECSNLNYDEVIRLKYNKIAEQIRAEYSEE